VIYDSLIAAMWRLVKRRWYVFAAIIALSILASYVLSGSSSHSVEQSVQIGSIEDAGSLLDAGDVPEVDVLRLSQQAQLDFDQSELNNEVAATYSANTTARTVTVRISGSSQEAVNTALLELNGRFAVIASGPITAQIDAGIGNADSSIASLQAATDDALEQIQIQELDQAALAVLIGEVSALRSDVSDANERRGVLVGLRDYVDDGFLIFGSSSVSESARGKVIYIAGAIAGITIALLAAAAWVLVDHRVRRVVHLERAAPGTPILGLVSKVRGKVSTSLDSSLRAAARSFVVDHELNSVTVFGISGSSGVDALGGALQEDVDVPVNISTSDSAGSVALDHDEKVGYVAVARWGSTTEEQVSAAVGDIRRAGSAPIGLVLMDTPDRDRDWVAAGNRPPGA